jgi:hypothetical protein
MIFAWTPSVFGLDGTVEIIEQLAARKEAPARRLKPSPGGERNGL